MEIHTLLLLWFLLRKQLLSFVDNIGAYFRDIGHGSDFSS